MLFHWRYLENLNVVYGTVSVAVSAQDDTGDSALKASCDGKAAGRRSLVLNWGGSGFFTE